MATRRISERRIVDVLMEYLRHEHQAAREVRHYEKRIDVVMLTSDSKELWTIEAKISDWSRAISQALVNLCAGERSYIAIYSKNAHRVDEKALDSHGIGLITVGTRWGEVEVVKKAERSPYTNRLMMERLKTSVAGGTH